MTSLRIVPLSEEHIDNICEIETESFSDPWSREFFLDLLDNDYAVCLVVEELPPSTSLTPPSQANGAVAGYLIAYHILDEIQILNIAVKESHRHRKIATRLFDVIFEYAKAENAEEFTLEVRLSNVGAIALYKKLGFEIDGVRKNYYTNPKEDAVLMSLKV